VERRRFSTTDGQGGNNIIGVVGTGGKASRTGMINNWKKSFCHRLRGDEKQITGQNGEKAEKKTKGNRNENELMK